MKMGLGKLKKKQVSCILKARDMHADYVAALIIVILPSL